MTIRIHTASGLGLYAVDFIADYHFPGPATITGFQIRSGAAGQTGGVVLDSGITSSSPVVSQTGSGTIQIQIAGTLSANGPLARIANNPGQYYAEIQTAANPNGAMRGQLAATQQSVALALMDQLSETPPIFGTGAATGSLTATVTPGASGSFTSAEVTFDVNYTLPAADTIMGVELRAGPAGSSGPAVISASIATSQQAANGTIHLRLEVDLTQPAAAAAVNALFADPSGYYLNLLTASLPSGAARGQLARASRSQVSAQLNVGQVCGQYRGEVELTFDVLRSRAGDVQAALVTFDGDYLAPTNSSLVFFGVPNDVLRTSLSPSNPLKSATGLGNIYESVLVSSAIALTQVENMLLGAMESVQLRTDGGSILGGTAPTFPTSGHLQISNIMSGAGDASAPIAAPGGIISIFGQFPGGTPDLAPVDVSGFYNQAWPMGLNGVWVTIGDRRIPMGYHSRTQINAQVPADLAPGTYEVRYWASRKLFSFAVSPQDQPDYRSDPYLLIVGPQAPAIFITPSGAAVVHGDTGALVSQSAPAAAGENILIYVTGIVAGPAPSAISASIGGRSVTASVAAVPGFTGLELVSLTIPANVSGTQDLTVQAGGVSSNAVQLFIQ